MGVKKLVQMANEFYRLGNVVAAKEMYRQVLDENPDHLLANYNLGLLYYKKEGDLINAIKHWKRCVDKDPQGKIGIKAKENLSKIDKKIKDIGAWSSNIVGGKSSSP